MSLSTRTHPSAIIVFADITQSTALYQTLGNDRAVAAVTRVTQFMARVFERHGGLVVKTLGDGVLARFIHPDAALQALVVLQREHQLRMTRWPTQLAVQIRAGGAFGDVVEQGGDCFGEAVNLAARLCDVAAAGEVWIDGALATVARPPEGAGLRELGPMPLRGFAEPQMVVRVDWSPADLTSLQTLPSGLTPEEDDLARARALASIELAWMDQHLQCQAAALPIVVGRARDADLVIPDLRVSRQHLRVDWVEHHFVLTDLSSYGTWVRMGGAAGSELALRRSECVLFGHGEIALGAPFSDFTAVTVNFAVHDGGVTLQRQR